MKSSARTQGATMIMVVLFTLLLLAGIMAATVQLSLGSRQNTADQVATLRAQYAAEGGVALAQSRLRDIQTMLSNAGNTTTGLKLPRTTQLSAVRTWIDSLCGTSPWSAMTEGGEKGTSGYYDKVVDGSGTVDNSTSKYYPAATQCQPNNLGSADSYTLFAKLVQAGSYAVLPTSERPATDEQSLKNYWLSIFNPAGMNAGDLSLRLTIPRVIRLQNNHYRVFVRVPSMTSMGNINPNARRVINGQSDKQGEWWFEVVQPSLLDAVVQDDFHKSADGRAINFTTNTRFQGAFKTNDIFTFNTSTGNNSPSFSGKISSAGCIDRSTTDTEITCNRDPGVRINDTVKRDFTGTDAAQSQSIRNHIANQGVNVNYNGTTPDFASAYEPFPEAATIQENAANGQDENGNPLGDGSRGLVLGSTEVGVEMFVGDANMNQPSTYNTTNRTWQEPTPAYQYIRPVTSTNCTESLGGTCSPTYSNTIYRVDSNMNMYSKTGTGAWTSLNTKFNGAIFKGGTVTDPPLSVFGPTRISGTTPEASARPALASFMGITVASPRPIDMRSDLALSQTPCRFDEYDTVTVSPPCSERRNVLGVFSSAGKIVVKKQVPNNAVIQAALMSSQQEFTVDGYNSGSPRGDIKFTGSLVEKYYGANGTFGTEDKCVDVRWWGCARWTTVTVNTGYNRDYSHDKRFLDGLIPPFYPVSPKWDMKDASRDGRGLSRLLLKQGS